jgi:hypothetical protein
MTKEYVAKQLGIVGTFDYAIPEGFNDQMREFIECPPAHFVWSYEGNSLFGFPRPLTESGIVALELYNAKHGTSYETYFKVLPLSA